jgi:hypothetical protein
VDAKVDQVFVMRFWHELGSETIADPDRWRVRIRHVNSRRQLYAVGLEKAFHIIKDTLIAETDSKGEETL